MSYTSIDRTARAEDLAWMAETGETIPGAAHRLGISTDALEKWCDHNGHRDLFRQLQRNSRAA